MLLSFLRVRGGVSSYHSKELPKLQFSPRTRRCFYKIRPKSTPILVFSAYAEVFLAMAYLPQLLQSFLRASGGVSITKYLSCVNR